ncbi:MAG: DNRLRE domain-containing protein [Acidobacteriota bacterium]
MASVAIVLLVTCVAARGQNTGITPLDDLGTGQYQGYQGGLYPGGVNTPPAGHAAAALALGQQIVPRDAAGNPDPAGLVGFVAIGMSNTTYEFSVFERGEDTDGARNAQVVLLNTAYGGQDSVAIRDPAAFYWTRLSQKLAAMGMTAAQVQVAWLKEATIGPPNNFPVHAQQLRDDEKAIVRILHDSYPNLKICYVSSRIFGGYSNLIGNTLNPEPQAFESGFSVKWLIEDQINGDPTINYDPANGPVEAPLLLWGPYLWADGTNPRSDGLVWLASDLTGDGVHPSYAGEVKVAGMLTSFFHGEPSAQPWWWSRPGYSLRAVDASDDAYVQASTPTTSYGAGGDLFQQTGSDTQNTYLKFDVSGVPGPALRAKLSLRVEYYAPDEDVSTVASTSWDESTITFGNAPSIGSKVADLREASHDSSQATDLSAVVNGDPDGVVALALTVPVASTGGHVSKDGGAPTGPAQPPRIVMIVPSGLDLVAGQGLAQTNPNEVAVLNGAGQPTGVDFLAYAAGQWGVNVSAADIDGGLAEIVTGPGPGAVFGPQCRAFDRAGASIARVNFFAYGTLRYGLNVSAPNVDGDATREIVTGPGPGAVFGPHVRGFNYDGNVLAAIAKISFFSYGTLKFGVNVRGGSIDADGFDEIETGPGPGSIFAPQVRGFDYDGTAISAIAKVNFNAFTTLQYGVNLAVGEADGDAYAEIACAPGPGAGAGFPARFLGFDYDASSIAAMPGYDVTAFATSYGGRPSLADLDADGTLDLSAAPGPAPSAPSSSKLYTYSGSALTPIGTFQPFAGSSLGPNVTSGDLGY